MKRFLKDYAVLFEWEYLYAMRAKARLGTSQ